MIRNSGLLFWAPYIVVLWRRTVRPPRAPPSRGGGRRSRGLEKISSENEAGGGAVVCSVRQCLNYRRYGGHRQIGLLLSLQHCASAERLLLYMFSLELRKHAYYVAENMHASADTMSTFYC